MNPLTCLVLAWRITVGDFIHALRMWLAQMAHAMPIMLLVFNLMLGTLAWVGAQGLRSVCLGEATPSALWGSAVAMILCAALLRGHAPSLVEARALPGGAVFATVGEMLVAGLAGMPVFMVALAGIVWALTVRPEWATAIRALLLMMALVALAWSILARRGWTMLAGIAIGFGALASLLLPGLVPTLMAVLGMVALFLILLRTTSPGERVADGGWRPKRGFLIVDICASRPAETGLRMGSALGCLGFGTWWRSALDSQARPAGLILVCGAAMLCTCGFIRVALEYRADREDLVAALPVGPVRWMVTACTVPMALHLLFTFSLGTILVLLGSSPSMVAIAGGASLITAVVVLTFVHTFPHNGIVLAVLTPVLATRLIGAFQS